ncbi:MAG: TerB family tellurite resistance protein [Oscillatoriophycideae cyanobacterium NC_groundwater_1537_Pr4_S-0.65um_50_18]|nr:TerB family tellurite resistance protein [Oscillatoriophycideae cyanobacterium NC_groundwater_1537_Pr4_S-0.65um_50_18]
MVYIPPPPSISPRQMNLLRTVTAMAWADGDLAAEEVEIMLDRFSSIFAQDTAQQQYLRQELQNYMKQNIPLEEITSKLNTTEEKEMVLRLAYEVISCSARSPEEENINADEAAAYQRLIGLLGLPAETVQRIESEAQSCSNGNLVDRLAQQLEKFSS